MTNVKNPYGITIKQAKQLASTQFNCNVLGRVRAYVLGQKPVPAISKDDLAKYVLMMFQLAKLNVNHA
jgi:hypothetical protein